MSLSVSDSRKLLINLVGTERVLERNQLTNFFRAFLMTKVKTYIAQEMRSSAINIFEIDEQLESFSAAIKAKLDDDFLDYGVNLKRFFVTVIVKPDGDPQYEKFKELHFRQYADIAEAKLRSRCYIRPNRSQKVVIDSQAQARNVLKKDIPISRSAVLMLHKMLQGMKQLGSLPIWASGLAQWQE